jgi:cytochrome c peroxidase
VRCVRIALACLAAAALGATPARLAAQSEPLWSEAEQVAIRALGPWPVQVAPERSNRVAGNALAIEFGQLLFETPRLSGRGAVRCASCHEPWRAFSDGRAIAFGLARGTRNSPTLYNVGLQHWFGWDGASDTLWGQVIRPLQDAHEMASSAAHVAEVVRDNEDFLVRYVAVFGAAPSADDDEVMVNVAKVIAAYVATIVSPRSAFDRYRDHLGSTDGEDADLSRAAVRGLRLFVGRAGCSDCHSGADFSDGEFHRSLVAAGDRPDRGRAAGLERLAHSAYTRAGRFSDLPESERRSLTTPDPDEALRGYFRTPGLREVARTAPYMHDGSVTHLCQATHAHALRAATTDAASTERAPEATLTEDERRDLVAFMRSLGSEPVASQTTPDAFDCT